MALSLEIQNCKRKIKVPVLLFLLLRKLWRYLCTVVVYILICSFSSAGVFVQILVLPSAKHCPASDVIQALTLSRSWPAPVFSRSCCCKSPFLVPSRFQSFQDLHIVLSMSRNFLRSVIISRSCIAQFTVLFMSRCCQVLCHGMSRLWRCPGHDVVRGIVLSVMVLSKALSWFMS